MLISEKNRGQNKEILRRGIIKYNTNIIQEQTKGSLQIEKLQNTWVALLTYESVEI